MQILKVLSREHFDLYLDNYPAFPVCVCSCGAAPADDGEREEVQELPVNPHQAGRQPAGGHSQQCPRSHTGAYRE